jgi:hypothetical protein
VLTSCNIVQSQRGLIHFLHALKRGVFRVFRHSKKAIFGIFGRTYARVYEYSEFSEAVKRGFSSFSMPLRAGESVLAAELLEFLEHPTRARGRIFRIFRSIQARAFVEFVEAAMRDGSNLRSLRSIPMRTRGHFVEFVEDPMRGTAATCRGL